MVIKLLLTTFILLSSVNANDFEINCLSCHESEFKFQMFMKKYTIKHSSEKRIKEAIFKYLKNPTYKTSLLPYGYLSRFGIKDKTNLEDKELIDMIDIYYKEYNLKSKIY